MFNYFVLAGKTAWYEMNITGVIVGALTTLITFIIAQHRAIEHQKLQEKQNMIYFIVQSHRELFSCIYQGSLNKDNIDYIKLRKELEESNLIFILPEEIRAHYKKLIDIYSNGTEYYKKHKKNIYNHLVNIVNELEKYGVDAFEHK